jgi:uncharacterized protein YndB with AHSA1/START domain
MPVTDIQKDLDALTMTVVAEYEAPVVRCWRLWADPRQLERWWGPPMFPATFVDHDFTPGSLSSYFMTSPEGEKHHGWWRILVVEAPHGFEIEDGFGDDPGNGGDMPVTTMRVRLADRSGGGTRMTIDSKFPSRETMEQVLAMGLEEGLRAAMGQIDGVLASA